MCSGGEGGRCGGGISSSSLPFVAMCEVPLVIRGLRVVVVDLMTIGKGADQGDHQAPINSLKSETTVTVSRSPSTSTARAWKPITVVTSGTVFATLITWKTALALSYGGTPSNAVCTTHSSRFSLGYRELTHSGQAITADSHLVLSTVAFSAFGRLGLD